jgi:hypothetical protein
MGRIVDTVGFRIPELGVRCLPIGELGVQGDDARSVSRNLKDHAHLPMRVDEAPGLTGVENSLMKGGQLRA